MIKNFDLSTFNTFKVSAVAALFTEINTVEDLDEVIEYLSVGGPFFILGSGANVLFAEDYQGLVIKNNLKGIKILSEDKESINLVVGSGEDWTELVAFAVEKNWSGIENLAFIPGTVGAAVVQNIAAYGQNFEDVFVEAEGINLLDGDIVHFSKEDCRFNYRTSVFKGQQHQHFFITSVTIQLSKRVEANISYHSRYESLESELVGKETPYSVSDIYQAVIALRKKKLPDWQIVGTAGSFFKNPVISKKHFLKLQEKVSELQSYPVERLNYSKDAISADVEYVKVPAGRLLDELGWKGKRIGNVATFEKQALVVINLGGASGADILKFTQQMAADVLDHYEIALEPEVYILKN